jgi:hypothetical protein
MVGGGGAVHQVVLNVFFFFVASADFGSRLLNLLFPFPRNIVGVSVERLSSGLLQILTDCSSFCEFLSSRFLDTLTRFSEIPC